MMPCPCCGRGDAFGEAEDINPLLGVPLGGWHDNRPTHAEIVNEAVDGLRADLQASPATDAGEVRAAPSDEWQPIESAPREFETVLIGRDNGNCCVVPGFWTGDCWMALAIIGAIPFSEPTHWRPLPAPPAAAVRGLAR